jgi:hypothetical protein
MNLKHLYALLLILGTAAVNAATFTATNSANWNTASTWDPNGVPGTSDLAVIPSGRSVTYGGTPSSVGAVEVSGTLNVSGSGTLGDLWIDTTGTLNPITSGASIIFAGSVTNNGNMSITALGSATTFTYSGTDKFLVGNISNVIASFSGNYRNLGTFVTGLKGTQDALKGAGALTNLATLLLANGQNTTPSIAVLDCTAPGNLVVWTNFNGTPVPKATTYYDLILGHTGSAQFRLHGAGLSILHDLTIINSAGVVSWPTDLTIPGTLTYSASGGTAATLTNSLTVGAFHQTAGTVAINAGLTLTVTGTGVGAWSRSGGTFAPSSTGTVRFTGAAPDIGGSVANGFTSLLIDSTAANATASGVALYVTNALTIASGGSLDVTALSGNAHAMLGAESFFGSGTLKGSVTTVSGSKIYGATDSAYGTNRITADLTMATGSTINLDVNSSAGAVNDGVAVTGALTLNNTSFRLKAPSAGAAIDTANDYTLVTAGSISGTPVLNWITAPANSGSYSLVVSGTSIKLHFGGTPGSPVLSSVVGGGNITLSWDSTGFPGYILQGQTNSTGIGSSGWGPVPSGNTSPVPVAIDPANPAVFFRLFKP